MEIQLGLFRDHVEVFLENTSTVELRLWELDNSWGYWSISFQLSNEQDSNIYFIRRRSDTEFTVNGANYFVIAPGARREISMNFNDGWWEWEQSLLGLKDKIISVCVSYSYSPSPLSIKLVPESNNYGVFTGSAQSDWVESKPPHAWLFT
jgi:hypothetical protein